LVTVMQVVDTSVTNVALPHMQGSLSASVDEIAWVLTSYLAANAVIIPATGWLSGLLGRKRFFLICTLLFTLSSFLSGIAPSLEGLGIALMVVGFSAMQYVLDRGEREDWFESGWMVTLAVIAVCALAGFVAREVTTDHPILDFSVFRDRIFTLGAALVSLSAFGLYASMLLVALYTQQVLGYDAWNAGLVLAPGGVGNMI